MARKPTHGEMIVEAFRERHWEMTLGELLDVGRFSFAHKLTARLSDLRAKGYVITCETADNASRNLYRMTPPVTITPDLAHRTEEIRNRLSESGQFEMSDILGP